MQMQVHHFLVPHQRRNRVWNAIRNNGHKVVPIWPGPAHESLPLQRDIFDQSVDDESIEYLEEREAELAFPTGEINQATAVEVTTALAQDLMDELASNQGAPIWTPHARYYLFDYVEPSKFQTGERMFRGLSILNDGQWLPYPGNLIDGHLVHWEHEPFEAGAHPLPREFLDYFSSKVA